MINATKLMKETMQEHGKAFSMTNSLPDPNADTFAVEFSVTKPLIDSINDKAKNDTTTIWPSTCKN